MIPPFDSNGYLPAGIHVATIDEFKDKFVYGSKRIEIFKGLERLISDLKSVGCNVMYVDGSFVSEKFRPGDADVCWELVDDPYFETFAKRTCPILFMTAGKRPEQQIKYCCDVFIANIYETASGLMFLDFFQKIKYTNERKGIIKIELL